MQLVEQGVLTVAAYPHFYPVCYINKSNEIDGLDVTIINKFAKYAGLLVNYLKIDKFDQIWDLVHEGIADIAIGGIANLKSRTKERVEWTIPYFYVHRSAMFLESDPIESPFPSKVQRIIIGTPGSTGWLDGEIKLGRHRYLMHEGTTNENDVSRLLHDGNVQGLMRGDFVSRAIIKQHPQIKMITWDIDERLVPSDGEIFAFPCRINSGLAVLMSTFITHMIETKQLPKIMKTFDLI